MDELFETMMERNEYEVLEPQKDHEFVDWSEVEDAHFQDDDRFGGY